MHCSITSFLTVSETVCSLNPFVLRVYGVLIGLMAWSVVIGLPLTAYVRYKWLYLNLSFLRTYKYSNINNSNGISFTNHISSKIPDPLEVHPKRRKQCLLDITTQTKHFLSYINYSVRCCSQKGTKDNRLILSKKKKSPYRFVQERRLKFQPTHFNSLE